MHAFAHAHTHTSQSNPRIAVSYWSATTGGHSLSPRSRVPQQCQSGTGSPESSWRATGPYSTMKAWKYWEILILLSKESAAGGKTRKRGDKLLSDRAILSGLLSKDATYHRSGLSHQSRQSGHLLRMIVPSRVSLICGRMTFKSNITTVDTGCHSYLQGDPFGNGAAPSG